MSYGVSVVGQPRSPNFHIELAMTARTLKKTALSKFENNL